MNGIGTALATASTLFCALCLLAPATVSADTPADGLLPFAPQLTADGSVHVVQVLADGRIALGGDFHLIDGQPRRGFALLAPDGSLAAPTPAVDGVVRAVAEDASGRLYLGGDFAHVDSQPRWRMARLLANGQLDPSWDVVVCRAQCTIHALAVAGNGANEGGSEGILIAGNLQYPATGAITREYLLRLRTADASLEEAWNPDARGRVTSLLLDGRGGLFAGGAFDRFGSGSPQRHRIARLHADTGQLDATWHSSIATAGYGEVRALMLSPDGLSLYVGGGSLNQGAGAYRVEVARVSAVTGVPDPAWLPPMMSGSTRGLAMDSDGRVYAGGSWFRRTVRFAADGSLDPSWAPPLRQFVNALAIDDQDRVHVGGEFRLMSCTDDFGVRDPQLRVGYAVFDTAAGLLPARNAERNGRAMKITPQSDGGLLLGREPLEWLFDRIDGYQVGNKAVVRLGPDGRLDRRWRAPFQASCGEHQCDELHAVLALPNNRVLLGGILWHEDLEFVEDDPVALWQVYGEGNGQTVPSAEFDTRAGAAISALARDAQGRLLVAGGKLSRLYDAGGEHLRNAIARLDGTTGLVEPGFNPGPIADEYYGQDVSQVVPTLAGALYLGGTFTNLGGVPRTGLARVFEDGSLDPSWAPVPGNCSYSGACGVRQLAMDGTGRVYVAGAFASIDGVARAGLARLAGSGADALDLAWNPAAVGAVASILPAAAGGLFVGGQFSQIGGLAQAWLARLDGAGQADASWQPQPDDRVRMLARSFDDSRLYVSGDFSHIGGQPRMGLAAFAVDFSGAPVPIERVAPAAPLAPGPAGSDPVLPAACRSDLLFQDGFEGR